MQTDTRNTATNREPKTKVTVPADKRFAVGDAATECIHTDCHAARVIKVSPNGKTVIVRLCNQRLLNGPTSGEPDAMTVTPGGFAGHTEGRQRYEVTDNPDGATRKFTFRSTPRGGIWKAAGASTFSPGNTLSPGHHPFYDFNF
jgi:hypothetical protein